MYMYVLQYVYFPEFYFPALTDLSNVASAFVDEYFSFFQVNFIQLLYCILVYSLNDLKPVI